MMPESEWRLSQLAEENDALRALVGELVEALTGMANFDGCDDEYCNWCGCLDKVNGIAEAAIAKAKEVLG